MVSLVGLTLSITGAKIPGFTSKVEIMSDQAPGGRPRSRSRSEDLQYLVLIQVQLVQK